ncbi:hypothetical protein C5B42_00255 [Candidatus Cerribacteria bacterium 'Amazon FNV 2010 28 9']|uniref:Uncharacterized protein n=1 Tax=Candidatus Cerribacteria bacterium 'Amazon FNV 2010 28 9' TaxID=2081795 RepID=A0A317JQF6_9BACT|nr:MAG: hypothetical protein C5B42_00255 [Candidatus Cerribacteria bacterium 'Amazon FNV 2010 28 9']
MSEQEFDESPLTPEEEREREEQLNRKMVEDSAQRRGESEDPTFIMAKRLAQLLQEKKITASDMRMYGIDVRIAQRAVAGKLLPSDFNNPHTMRGLALFAGFPTAEKLIEFLQSDDSSSAK